MCFLFGCIGEGELKGGNCCYVFFVNKLKENIYYYKKLIIKQKNYEKKCLREVNIYIVNIVKIIF